MSKTILLTGATDGIGLVTAKSLAAEGHKLLIHGRSEAKLSAAAAEIGEAEAYLADMSKMGEVEAMASAILAKHERLDVLINNAGVFRTPVTRTAEDLDTRFYVNTFAPYVLTKRLLPIMSPEGRVVNLSSAAQARVDVSAMAGKAPIDDMGAYSQSKLALNIWTRAMAASLPQGPVIVAVNPGSLLASKMVKEGFGVAGNDLQIGADILIRAALDPSFEGVSGAYFDNDTGRFSDPNPAALDAGHAKEVMETIERVIASLNQSDAS